MPLLQADHATCGDFALNHWFLGRVSAEFVVEPSRYAAGMSTDGVRVRVHLDTEKLTCNLSCQQLVGVFFHGCCSKPSLKIGSGGAMGEMT